MVGHARLPAVLSVVVASGSILAHVIPLVAQAPAPCDREGGLAAHVETVLDRATRTPLVGASVVAEWRSAADGTARASTDSTGKAFLCAPSDREIIIRASYHDVRSEALATRLVLDRATVRTTVLDVPGVFIRGEVIDEQTGLPLPNVEIRLLKTPLSTLTNADGKFRFERVPRGDYTLGVQHISYATLLTTLRARDEDLSATVRLTPSAIALQPITVTAFSRRLDRTGFYEREKRGVGTFLGRKQIEAMNVQYASDLLRNVPGARLVPQMPRRNVPPSALRGRGNCRYRFIVDGSRTLPDFEMDFLSAHAIEGVEIYNGLAEVPAPFRAVATPETGAPTCGVVAIWTRDGR